MKPSSETPSHFTTDLNALGAIGSALKAERFPDADVLFLAGSVVRGEGTPHSDLDVIVLYERVETASRDSFYFRGWPVEVFLHDPETIRYFFEESDRPTGIPALAQMISDGIEIPGPTPLSTTMKKLARDHIKAGPGPLKDEDLRQSCYIISDLCDDLRAPRSSSEAIATATLLHPALAGFYLRSQGQWSAKGKAIPRKLKQYDPDWAAQFDAAFEALFARQDRAPALSLAERTLAPFGGFSFEYTSSAPSLWRIPPPPVLETERLILRLPDERDVPDIVRHFKENEKRFAPTDPKKPEGFMTEHYWTERVRAAHREFRAGQSLKFFLFGKTDPRIIGSLNFTQMSRGPFQACSLGYAIDGNHEGQGLMIEALRAATQHVFLKLGFHRIEAGHLPENERSRRVLEALGFRTEGRAEAYLLINGAWRSHILASLTHPDWKPEL